MHDILELIWITLLPFLELRASIPYGIIVKEMNWILVFAVCVITNIILAPIVYVFLDKFVHFFFFIKPVKKLYNKYVEKTQRKISKYVDKYGELGVALFIAIPLPGSGVYSGALGSYVLGLKFRKFMLAAVIGVLIAGIIVTLISVFGGNGLSLFIKSI
jgi:uncharacterized membrane protein